MFYKENKTHARNYSCLGPTDLDAINKYQPGPSSANQEHRAKSTAEHVG